LRSEGIDSITLDIWPDQRLQPLPICDIDTDGEQVTQVLGDLDIFEGADRCARHQFDHNVYIAPRARFPARKRPEQSDVQHASITQIVLVRPKNGYHLITI